MNNVALSVRNGGLAPILRNYAIVWVTIGLFVLVASTTDNFLTSTNLLNIADQQATLLIVASVVTLSVIAGGFDVSLSAIFVLSALVSVRVENSTGHFLLAIIAGVAAGLAAGTFNALCVSVLRINSFIATLASSFVLFGVSYLVSDASVLRPEDLGYRKWVTIEILGLSGKTWIALIVVAATWITLEHSRFGRYVFATGGNAEAARLSGVRVQLILAATFILSGAAAGLAGTINAASSLSAQASDDFSFIFSVIAAVVVGGTSIAGGEGAVWKTVTGVFFIALLNNAFNLNGVDPIYQRIILGLVILVAVGVDSWTREHQA